MDIWQFLEHLAEILAVLTPLCGFVYFVWLQQVKPRLDASRAEQEKTQAAIADLTEKVKWLKDDRDRQHDEVGKILKTDIQLAEVFQMMVEAMQTEGLANWIDSHHFSEVAANVEAKVEALEKQVTEAPKRRPKQSN